LRKEHLKEYLEHLTYGRDKITDTFNKKQEFEEGREIVHGKRKRPARKQKAEHVEKQREWVP
jgi:hypothetical protein